MLLLPGSAFQPKYYLIGTGICSANHWEFTWPFYIFIAHGLTSKVNNMERSGVLMQHSSKLLGSESFVMYALTFHALLLQICFCFHLDRCVSLVKQEKRQWIGWLLIHCLWERRKNHFFFCELLGWRNAISLASKHTLTNSSQPHTHILNSVLAHSCIPNRSIQVISGYTYGVTLKNPSIKYSNPPTHRNTYLNLEVELLGHYCSFGKMNTSSPNPTPGWLLISLSMGACCVFFSCQGIMHP